MAALRILVTDEVDLEGVALLTAVPEFKVDVVPTLAPDELLQRIGDYDAFVGRSATRIIKRAGAETRYRVDADIEEARELYDDAVDPALQGSVGAAALTSKEWARWVAARAGRA